MTAPTIELSRLDRYTFREATELWNKGFEGYFNPMYRTLGRHLDYLAATGISPELSIVAVVDGQPAGFVLTALRTIEGRKTAWNGGTGIAPEYRGMGVGKVMMNEAVRIYREQQVSAAYLEAIFENDRAVALYRSCGFQAVDRLFCYRMQPSERLRFGTDNPYGYRTARVLPREVSELSYYRAHTAWCSQWPNVSEAMLVLDRQDEIAGYSLLKSIYADDGKLVEVKLLQAEADPCRTDGIDAVRFLLAELYAQDEADLIRSAENIPASSLILTRLLRDAGFETSLDQNLMELDLSAP